MKQLLIIFTAFAYCLTLQSCNENTKKATDQLKQTQQVVTNAVEVAKNAENIKKEIDILLTKEPLSQEQFKNWSPENIGDFKRENLTTNLMREMNLAMCSADYRSTKDANKRLYLTVTDGAGKTGASAISIFRNTQTMTINNTTDGAYQKSVLKNGVKAVEKFSKQNSGKYEIMFLHDNRFGVSIESRGVADANELWALIDHFKLDELTAMAK